MESSAGMTKEQAALFSNFIILNKSHGKTITSHVFSQPSGILCVRKYPFFFSELSTTFLSILVWVSSQSHLTQIKYLSMYVFHYRKLINFLNLLATIVFFWGGDWELASAPQQLYKDGQHDSYSEVKPPTGCSTDNKPSFF